jgi:phenylacetate-CoA ligase
VVVTGTEVTRFFWQATTLRDHFWHGRDFDQTLAVIRFFGERSDARDDKIAENWGSATSGWKKTGPCAMLDVFHTTDEQAEWLARVNPDYLLAYPSVVHALIRYCVKSGITFPNLKEVRTFGEVLEPNVRRLCQDAWGVKIVDAYSAAEVGYVALECPQSGCYHVQSEDVLLEVLDKHNAPCRPGEVGKVVVTSLHNFAMPLIRYDMGDFAEVGEACSCGRTLPALNRIIGRSRNMLALPDGRMRWPSVGSEVVDGVPGIRQAQAIQKDLDHIELNLVCEPRLNETQRNRLTQYVQEAFGHPFDISIVYRDRIERSPSGKYEDFRSEVPMPI